MNKCKFPSETKTLHLSSVLLQMKRIYEYIFQWKQFSLTLFWNRAFFRGKMGSLSLFRFPDVRIFRSVKSDY